jgi:hypothetical protein
LGPCLRLSQAWALQHPAAPLLPRCGPVQRPSLCQLRVLLLLAGLALVAAAAQMRTQQHSV